MIDFEWRDLAAGLAMIGLLASGERGTLVGQEAYRYADDLLDAKNDDSDAGIVGVKKRKSRVSKQEVA